VGIWERVKMAMNAAITTYREAALIPDDRYDWDDYQSRIFRYHFYSSYYNNMAYRDISRFANTYKRSFKLYKHIRGIYNPVARLVDMYVAKTYGGSLDYDALEGGAIPLTGADERLKDAIRQVWLWSNWGNVKSLYVRTGAQLGDVGLWVVDDREAQKVRIEVLHPGKIKSCDFDAVGNVKRVRFEFNMTRPDVNNGQEFTFAMDVDQEHFATYMNGQPYGFDAAGMDEAAPEWANDYGFVPLVIVQHKDVGQTWGGSVFHASIGKIDELNDAASLVNDSVRKNVTPIWYIAGAQASDLKPSGQLDDDTSTSDPTAQRDKLPMIYSSKPDSAPIAMVPNVDIASALTNINAILLEIERDMPELSMHRLREGGQLTAPGVRAAYSDAIDKIIEARGNYDDGLIRAQKMAVTIGGLRGYDNMRGYTLTSFADGALDHWIAERPVIDDTLTKQERLAALMGLPEKPAQARLVLEELEYTTTRIDEIIAEIETALEQQTRAAVRGMAEAWFGPQEGEGDDDEQPEAEASGTPAQLITGTTESNNAAA